MMLVLTYKGQDSLRNGASRARADEKPPHTNFPKMIFSANSKIPAKINCSELDTAVATFPNRRRLFLTNFLARRLNNLFFVHSYFSFAETRKRAATLKKECLFRLVA